MYKAKILVLFFLVCSLIFGCQSSNNETVDSLSKPIGIEFKENDVEDPEIFNAEGLAFWDGQSSLGGVWITHPNVDQATRVLIKDKYGGKSVVGAIFNRSGHDDEKRMLLSSEAAASLGVDANETRIITVTALRALKTVKSIKNTSERKSSEAEVGHIQNRDNENIALLKPYIQVGIFSIEQNARNTAEVMHQLNIQPTVKEQTSRNKTFWRVIVGPAVDMNERSTLLQKVKAVGFGDAYAVSK